MTTIPNGSVSIIHDVTAGAARRFQEVIGDAGQVNVRAIGRK